MINTVISFIKKVLPKFNEIKFYPIDPQKIYYAPTRGHDTDSGIDFRIPFSGSVEPGKSLKMPLNIGVELPKVPLLNDWVTVDMFLQPKSGLGLKGIITTGGVIDNGYTGELVANVINLGPNTISFDQGDKVCQGVLRIIFTPQPKTNYLESVRITSRGNAGFGSTGK